MVKRLDIRSSLNVFMFGNGVSRKGFDISSLKDAGLLVGFNWAYEEYPFDVICSADPEVSAQIDKHWNGDWIRRDNYGSNRNFRDHMYWNTHDHDDLICILPQLSGGMGWNTGRAAIYTVNAKYRPKNIYLFGFDIDRTNIYESANMAHRWKTAPDNYVQGWNSVLGRARMATITRVGPKDRMVDKLVCNHMTYEEFNDAVQRDRI